MTATQRPRRIFVAVDASSEGSRNNVSALRRSKSTIQRERKFPRPNEEETEKEIKLHANVRTLSPNSYWTSLDFINATAIVRCRHNAEMKFFKTFHTILTIYDKLKYFHETLHKERERERKDERYVTTYIVCTRMVF